MTRYFKVRNLRLKFQAAKIAGRSNAPKGHFASPRRLPVILPFFRIAAARRRSAPKVITHSHDFNQPPLPFLWDVVTSKIFFI
jgi:hypothetical protein